MYTSNLNGGTYVAARCIYKKSKYSIMCRERVVTTQTTKIICEHRKKSERKH